MCLTVRQVNKEKFNRADNKYHQSLKQNHCFILGIKNHKVLDVTSKLTILWFS